TRAALTGLRKKGYRIEHQKQDGECPSLYRIITETNQAMSQMKAARDRSMMDAPVRRDAASIGIADLPKMDPDLLRRRWRSVMGAGAALCLRKPHAATLCRYAAAIGAFKRKSSPVVMIAQAIRASLLASATVTSRAG